MGKKIEKEKLSLLMTKINEKFLWIFYKFFSCENGDEFPNENNGILTNVSRTIASLHHPLILLPTISGLAWIYIYIDKIAGIFSKILKKNMSENDA